jgi:hypothetical protein
VANLQHIQKAFLFCGPGLPEKEVEKFNLQNRAVHLIIRQVINDWTAVGDAHLGYQAPPIVQVDFSIYHGPKKNDGQDPHVAIYSKEPHLYEVEKVASAEKRDLQLHHKFKTTERVRSFIGPLVALILRSLRKFIRYFTHSRIRFEKGIKIGAMFQGRWQVDHFKPI